MAVNINNIVNVNISLSEPVVDNSTFGVILLIGSLPEGYAALEKQPDKVGTYYDITDVEAAGWTNKDELHKAATVAFSQDPKPEKIMIAPRQVGDENKVEDFLDTLKRAYETGGWYGVSLAGATDEDLNSVSVWIELTEKMFSFTTSSETCPIKEKDVLRTHGWFTNQTGAYDKYLDIAVMAKCFNYVPGSETWDLKGLRRVTPSVIGTSLANSLDAQNMNYYVSIAGNNVTQTGKVLGDEWIDTIRFRDWLKNNIQMKVFAALLKNSKLPFTDSGIAVIENCVTEGLIEGQNNGGIAEDMIGEDDEIIKAFETTVPKASTITEAQRKKRTLQGCKWTARLASAIQATTINGTLSY